MANTLQTRSYDNWVTQRKNLTANETDVLDAATAYFVDHGPTPEEKRITWPPTDYDTWKLQRLQMADEQIKAIDWCMKAFIASRKTLIPPDQPRPPPLEPIIGPTAYPEWWKKERTAAIGLSNAGSQQIIPAKQGYIISITAIVISASKETDVSFRFGVFGQSGAINLAGTDEPRSMVITMGDSPAPCGAGPFAVTSNGTDAAVGGFVVYSLEKEPTQPKK